MCGGLGGSLAPRGCAHAGRQRFLADPGKRQLIQAMSASLACGPPCCLQPLVDLARGEDVRGGSSSRDLTRQTRENGSVVPYWIGLPGRSARPTTVTRSRLDQLREARVGGHAADRFDLGAGHRLAVGNDRQASRRGLAQLHRGGSSRRSGSTGKARMGRKPVAGRPSTRVRPSSAAVSSARPAIASRIWERSQARHLLVEVGESEAPGGLRGSAGPRGRPRRAPGSPVDGTLKGRLDVLGRKGLA